MTDLAWPVVIKTFLSTSQSCTSSSLVFFFFKLDNSPVSTQLSDSKPESHFLCFLSVVFYLQNISSISMFIFLFIASSVECINVPRYLFSPSSVKECLHPLFALELMAPPARGHHLPAQEPMYDMICGHEHKMGLVPQLAVPALARQALGNHYLQPWALPDKCDGGKDSKDIESKCQEWL